MSYRLNFGDAQQALAFLVNQATHIEATVYRTQYPDIQYPMLVPVDESANEWAKSVTFFSMDRVGAADWFHNEANDMRLADVNRTKFEQGIEMAAIGYGYNLEELGQAMLVPGTNLTPERAAAARRAYEEFVDQVALYGDTQKGWTGLLNDASVTRVDATADGTGATRTWSTKTADQILRDVNDALTGIYVASNTVEMADTLLLPIESFTLIATKRLDATLSMSVLDYLQKYNVYTAQTGQPLMIRAVRGLENAGATSTGRMVAYRRSPDIVKLHLPMRHRFLAAQPIPGSIKFIVPGIFRLGGTEIRRPGAVRYVDGITS
jgi:hypothetical protein